MQAPQPASIARPQPPTNPLPNDGQQRIGIHFSALDTWFCRESRPHNAVGAAELESQFPPPARTLVGALRTLIGEQAGTDWSDYKRRGTQHPLASVIGHGNDLAPLDIDGPWPTLDGERLYPAPVFLLAAAAGIGKGIQRLAIGRPVETDLGRLRLPAIRRGERGAKPLTDHWINTAGLLAVLGGERPSRTSLKAAEDLFDWEPRLGIARDNRRRTVEEHMLYQTRHLRPRAELAIELGVRGLDPTHRPAANAVQRLGGEGRLAALETVASPDPIDALQIGKIPSGAKDLILILLTPADCNGNWLPGNFSPEQDEAGTLSWRGHIADVALRVHAAVLGKAQREGGWDLVRDAPRPVRSLIPAGSAWYCTLEDGDLASTIERLHGSRIGDAASHRLGRGLLAAGIWPKPDRLD